MFTGIVRALGVIDSIYKTDGGCELMIDLGKLDAELQAGDSVAVNGVCLTATSVESDGACVRHAKFDVSPETQARCLIGEWREGMRVNIEPALQLCARLGGHIVAGHVDCTGRVVNLVDDGGFARMEIEAPGDFGRLIARKGSIAVDGVSLTANEVTDINGQTRFTVMLVPHTRKATTLGAAEIASRVHLEADMLARYAQRLLETEQ